MRTRFSPSALALIVSLVVLQVIFVGYTQVTLERRNDQLLQSFRTHGMALYELQLHALHMRRYEKDYFLAVNDPAERSRYTQLWRDHKDLANVNLTLVENTADFSAADRAQFKQWRTLLANYTADFERATARIETDIERTGKIPDVFTAYSSMGQARVAIRAVLGESQTITDAQFAWLNTSSQSITYWNRLLILASTLVAMLIAWLIVLTGSGAFRIRPGFGGRAAGPAT
jgi:hypothetical protein